CWTPSVWFGAPDCCCEADCLPHSVQAIHSEKWTKNPVQAHFAARRFCWNNAWSHSSRSKLPRLRRIIPMTDPLTHLSQIVAREEDMDLGEAALAISAAHYPGLVISDYLQRLDALAAEARGRIGRSRRADRVIPVLNTLLLEEK